MDSIELSQRAVAGLLAGLPLLYAFAAWKLAPLVKVGRGWQCSLLLSYAVVALLLAVVLLSFGLGADSVVTRWIRVDTLSLCMTGLIAGIAVAILRYARAYLAGDPGEAGFVRWFFGTLASVSLLVPANHLLVISLGWIAASVCLHRLLTHYASRPQAQLAAHKKFLLSRLADLCLVSGFLLLGRHAGSFQLDIIFIRVETLAGTLPADLRVATLLIAFATILKCAQLPFHGWLIQVMEAPTPVSALLHAGVINIGGYLLIRLAPLMSLSADAQWLLVIVGGLTAVIAGLIMMTRISVKVLLAWSTCAQMGFMLLECGLGAYGLALLHLLAHSLYKAHAFLRSGSAVEVCVQRQMANVHGIHQWWSWILALGIGGSTVVVAAVIFHSNPQQEPALWVLGGIVSMGIATLVGEALALRDARAAGLSAAAGFALSLLYFGWHHLFVHLHLPMSMATPIPGTVLFVLTLFAFQYAVYAASRIHAGSRWVSRMHVFLYHGLYLDELFTRITFRLWPPRHSNPSLQPSSVNPQGVPS